MFNHYPISAIFPTLITLITDNRGDYCREVNSLELAQGEIIQWKVVIIALFQHKLNLHITDNYSESCVTRVGN